MSLDGRFVAFYAPPTAFTELPAPVWPGFQFVRRNLATGALDVASRSAAGQIVSLGWSSLDAISDDGGVIAFTSDSIQLVVPDANLVVRDVFVRDLGQDSLEIASVDTNGVQSDGPSYGGTLSGDGQRIAFVSMNNNFVPSNPLGRANVFVRDRVASTLQQVNVDSSGVPALDGTPPTCAGWYCEGTRRAAISRDGRFVAFDSNAVNLSTFDTNGWFPDIYVRDLVAGVTELVSVNMHGTTSWSGMARDPSISGDGRYVVFATDASDVTPASAGTMYTQIYRRDRLLQVTEMVSVDPGGVAAPNGAYGGAVSTDGRYVAFVSADPLAPPFGPLQSDVFVRDMWLGTSRRVSSGVSNPSASFGYLQASFRADGQALIFDADAGGLAAGDTNSSRDVFVVDFTYTAPPIATYCTATTNSLGCAPSITSSGLPTLSGQYAFFVSATGARNQRPGTLMWSFGPAQAPFFGGLRCVAAPVRILPASSTQGFAASTSDCSGWRSELFTPAEMLANGWTPGTVVYAQFAFRDPTLASGPLALSNALQFQVLP